MTPLARRLATLKREAGTSVSNARSGRGEPPGPMAPGGVADLVRPVRTGEASPSSSPLRLRHLSPQAEAGAAGDSPSDTHPSRRGSDATIDRLRRLLGVRERTLPLALAIATDRELPGEEIAPGLRLQTQMLPWPACPGRALDLAAFERDLVDPARLCFFDTETTGLAGGTGTRAFQIGVGDWHRGAFRVRQLTLTALAGEAAMLDEFARWLAPESLLVSYNGRSYDAPLLNTRFRLARRVSPLPGCAHLDLLHPVRRRYRGLWANCRLATVERELLGVVREDDLPGSEAPRAWLGYLRGGSARDLRRVAAHNRQDLVSLAALLLRLGVDADADASPVRSAD
jgi:uncharacterized protein YprB with RNaseH-like and TPR domain